MIKLCDVRDNLVGLPASEVGLLKRYKKSEKILVDAIDNGR